MNVQTLKTQYPKTLVLRISQGGGNRTCIDAQSSHVLIHCIPNIQRVWLACLLSTFFFVR